MLQACMQGNFLENLEISDCAQGKNLSLSTTNPVSMSVRFERKSLQPLKFLKNLQAVFKEVH